MAKAKSGLDPDRLLAARPTANRALRLEDRGDGLTLWVPIRRRWWMGPPLAWLLPFRTEKGVALDATGRQVFLACDGERTVEQIIDDFAEQHRMGFHDARGCVLTFLRSLAQRSLIALVVDRPESRAEARPA